MSGLEQQTLQPAYDGLDTDSSPSQMPVTRAPDVHNLLLDSVGYLKMRGPIHAAPVSVAAFPDYLPMAYWSWGNKLMVAYKAGASGRNPWESFVVETPAASLATAHTTLTFVDFPTGNSSEVTSVNRNQIPGPRYARLSSKVYGPAFDNTGTAQALPGTSYYQLPRKLLAWDGTSAAPTALTNAPDTSLDVVTHLNRLWLLAGRDVPSGTRSPAIEPNTLFYSVESWDGSDTTDSWKDIDPVTGTRVYTNKIVVGADDGDVVVGLGKVGKSLAIFKRHSLYLLSGSTPETFSLNRFSDSHGCLDARSIVAWKDGVFFLSEHGYMYFDGSQLVNMTESLRNSVVVASLDTLGDLPDNRNAFAVASRLPNDYIALTIGDMTSTPLFTGLLYAPRRSWATFSSGVISPELPFAFGRMESRYWLASGGVLVDCSKITAPLTASPGEYGIDFTGTVFTWPNEPSAAAFNARGVLVNTETGVSMFPLLEGYTASITARWTTRLFPLASQFYKSQLSRVLVDYSAKFLGASDGEPSWRVTVQDGNETLLGGAYTVAGQGDTASRYPVRRRSVTDCFNEASDAQLVIEWDRDPTPLVDATIQGVAVEYQPTRNRHSE